MSKQKPRYKIIINNEVLEDIRRYRDDIISGRAKMGKLLESAVNISGYDISNLSDMQFLNCILRIQKKYACSAEDRANFYMNSNDREFEILANIGIAAEVKIYDNGVWHDENGKYSNRFQVYDEPLTAELLFTAGPLIGSERSIDARTIIKKGVAGQKDEIDQEAYNKLIEKRLLPQLMHANAQAKIDGKPAVVNIPGLGAGAFAGRFEGRMCTHLYIAIKSILEKNQDNLTNIKMVHFDAYNEEIRGGTPEQETIGGIDFAVGHSASQREKNPMSPLSSLLGEEVDSSGYKLYKVVASDAITFPGNDYIGGSKTTDEGIAAGGTDVLTAFSGIEGEYSREQRKYLPTGDYSDFETWEQCMDHRGTLLYADSSNLEIFLENGQSVSLNDDLQINDNRWIDLPNIAKYDPDRIPGLLLREGVNPYVGNKSIFSMLREEGLNEESDLYEQQYFSQVFENIIIPAIDEIQQHKYDDLTSSFFKPKGYKMSKIIMDKIYENSELCNMGAQFCEQNIEKTLNHLLENKNEIGGFNIFLSWLREKTTFVDYFLPKELTEKLDLYQEDVKIIKNLLEIVNPDTDSSVTRESMKNLGKIRRENIRQANEINHIVSSVEPNSELLKILQDIEPQESREGIFEIDYAESQEEMERIDIDDKVQSKADNIRGVLVKNQNTIGYSRKFSYGNQLYDQINRDMLIESIPITDNQVIEIRDKIQEILNIESKELGLIGFKVIKYFQNDESQEKMGSLQSRCNKVIKDIQNELINRKKPVKQSQQGRS